MLKGFRQLVNRNGSEAHPGHNGHGANDHPTNGHGTNGSAVSECASHDADDTQSTAVPMTSIKIPGEFLWTLEIRQDQHILGSMHASNPFVLISFFRDYSMLYGNPVESYAVWLRFKESNRGAPLQYQPGNAAWVEFLRKLDPEIDSTLDEVSESRDRTSMLDPHGRPTHPDAVFELAFGLARAQKSA